MKTSEEYAELAESCLRDVADTGSHISVGMAQVYATLAAAAATLEVARMAGPTPQELAVLDALTAPNPDA